ncbi:hypothetical protein L204_104299 [Cryptococcus depauperatus]
MNGLVYATVKLETLLGDLLVYPLVFFNHGFLIHRVTPPVSCCHSGWPPNRSSFVPRAPTSTPSNTSHPRPSYWPGYPIHDPVLTQQRISMANE